MVDGGIEISGSYSIDTSPDSCIEGGLSFETIEPIKLGEMECPQKGKIKVNNAIMDFSPDGINVTVNNSSKLYACEEIKNIFLYEPIDIEICGATDVKDISLFLIPISVFIFYFVRRKVHSTL